MEHIAHDHTTAHEDRIHEVTDESTVETSETAPATETKLEYKPAAATPAKSVQVTLTLDAETHEYFNVRAVADDRSLNKFLARELRKIALTK